MTTCTQQFNMPQMICCLASCSSVSHAAAICKAQTLAVCLLEGKLACMSKGMVRYKAGHHGSDEGLTLQQRLRRRWSTGCCRARQRAGRALA